MPHLVLLYSPDLENDVDVQGLCRALANNMLGHYDENGKAVFPTGGTRVLAYPAAHSAVADGKRDYGFLYANLRIGAGRSKGVHTAVGDSLLEVLRTYMNPVINSRPVGLTLQIDESTNQVYDGKHSSLHPLFNKTS
ncbi:5-carboxymethyl-2-hydroxymuconate Delta-isomerase [Pseudomonas sp. 3-2]|jgi:5-carboxymethyl-2-hydroxymuconate isomerase|uniref:5-carboxymethyl-2-hydroxymuconate Delta-isomerase n=1 Tax=Pseudomonas sp. 3-2 TaxID=2867408 RepID=UPI001C875485|nr:5-carboxymethyl-2-hydroxymuconate Delta-isomerase [Pseudomonas sp. 3-2]QZD73330.1 5-carboxymethyl-2-hydroxymuconate Delta-isomerase [Pseudomonas sp. 3-2]